MLQVALVNVVHIKDSVCTLPTSILAQYLKQANGQLSCLKVMYKSHNSFLFVPFLTFSLQTEIIIIKFTHLSLIKNRLKRRKESGAYLATDSRHRHLYTPVMSTVSCQVGAALFPSF